ncbi:MAG: glycosyltransferase family 2 protein [Kiritimatiellae bacterium]|nr:glycosyltransferase family 2 protein [Kiritimatiellia bacterium]
MNAAKPYGLSVVMPALNEEKNIQDAVQSTLAAFDKHHVDGEVIVVNDGSTDNTKAIVEAIMKWNPRVRIVSHQRTMGIGYSFYDGIRQALKEVVVMFPGDNENNPDDALAYIRLMDNVDIIVPFIHNIEIRNRARRIISAIYRFVINVSFGINLNYTNGTVFYRRAILENIDFQSLGFFFQTELLVRLIRAGYLFAEVPNFLSKRSFGTSKAITLKSLIRVMQGYLQLVYIIHVKRMGPYRDASGLDSRSISYEIYSVHGS